MPTERFRRRIPIPNLLVGVAVLSPPNTNRRNQNITNHPAHENIDKSDAAGRTVGVV